MPAATIFCESCERFQSADRLDWNDLTEERQWGSDDDLGMGMYNWKSEPLIRYYRRVRRCSGCNELVKTAELDETALAELARLREEVRALRAKLLRAQEHAGALVAELDI